MPNSYVMVKEGDKAYVGWIKEMSIGLWWYKGPIKEGSVVINRNNIFDLIEMKEISDDDLKGPYYHEVEGVVCRVGLSGLRTCVDTDSLTDGMYLCRAGSKEWEKVKEFVLNFWKKRNEKMVCTISQEDKVFRNSEERYDSRYRRRF